MSISSEPYFEAYEDLHIHHLMLEDRVRVEAYRLAILNNKDLFKDKVVLDVGAGTGILSIFAAQTGAKTVYAVEAAESLFPIIETVIYDNNYSGTIKLIKGRIENVSLPEMVDIIISEWMGFFLLHEGMLDSVLHAKKHLKKDGIMFPDGCKIFAAPCSLPQYFDKWHCVNGVNMSAFGAAFRSYAQSKPEICHVDKNCLLSKPLEIYSFKPINSQMGDFDQITGKHVVTITSDGKYQGVCIWFEVSFSTPSEKVILSTSPFDPETHWKQTVIVLPQEELVEEGDPVAFEMSFQKHGQRRYQITFEMIGSEDIDHPVPCDCSHMKCVIVKAYSEKNPLSESC